MAFIEVECCKTCGHVTCYKNSRRYECMKMVVSPNGICDRYQENISPTGIMRKIDEAMKELENVEDGQYQIKQRPPFHQNYHIIEGKRK